MSLTHRPLSVAALVAGLCLAPALPAAADGGLGWLNCAPDSTDPGCEVGARSSSQPGRTPTVPPSRRAPARPAAARECHAGDGQVVPCYDPAFGALADDGCYYRSSSPSPDLQKALGGPGDGPGGWYDVTCPGLSGTGGGTVWRAGPPPGQPTGAPTPEALAQQARSRLGLPDLRISISPAGSQLVRLPTWLWIEPEQWRPRTASASVPGVAVTATATPTQVVWSTGDGATVTCAGPGTPWRAGLDPAAPSPTCGHVYPRGSARAEDGVFTVTATVSWSISWAGAGQAGALPALSTSSSVPVRVDEVQAVVVS